MWRLSTRPLGIPNGSDEEEIGGPHALDGRAWVFGEWRNWGLLPPRSCGRELGHTWGRRPGPSWPHPERRA